MPATRWHRIEDLYHAACERAPKERPRYLERMCGDDQALRHEVESLLNNDELAREFLESGAAGALAEVSEASVPPGEQIGPYRILEFLRAGGMGEVYKARDIRLDRTVAIKFLPWAFSRDSVALDRFQREARAASALNHPRICTVHDLGEYQGRPFLVMEFLEGQSLRDRIGPHPVAIPELAQLAVQICDALQAAHAKGIVHRDIKPANIFVLRTDGNGHPPQIKILDFGLAKLNRDAHPAGDPVLPAQDATVTLNTLTLPGSLMGTLAYLSPEQARGQEVDARTDLFSFGVVLYQMATGRPTFRGETSGELIGAILHETPAAPSELNPAVPGELDRIILKALEKDRDRRYQSATEMMADLERVQRSATAGLRTRRRLLASCGTAAVSLAGGAFLSRLGIFTPKHKTMLAVLPLENLNGDPQQGYLVEGLHAEMISIIGRLYPDSLAVIAGPSVSRYQGSNRKIDQVGKELKVDYVVEGGVRRDGSRVHVTARLIRVQDQAQIWSAAYDRDLHQIVALQSEIAQASAQGIERNLRPSAQVRQALDHPLNPDAYEAYLHGDYEKSIALDPSYAPAHAGLASDSYYQALFGGVRPEPGFRRVMDEAMKSVELDPTLATGHAFLALAKLHRQWRWADAESDFRRALRLDPNDAESRHNFAHFLLWMNRGKESAEECNRAVELNPFDPGLIACLAWHHVWAGDYSKAIETARRALTFQPNEKWALMIMGWAYEQKAMFPEALAALQKSFAGTLRTSAIAHMFAVAGNRPAAQNLLEQLLDQSQRQFVPAYDVAVVYTGLGETQNAMLWLEKAFEEHSGFMPYVNLDPRFRPLRSTERFHSLRRRMGIASEKA